MSGDFDFSGIPQRNVRIEHIQFASDEIVAVVLEGEGVAVPIVLVCTALGLDAGSQVERLRGHDVLLQALRFVKVPVRGRVRSVVAILHTHIAFWLATITPSQVSEAVRPKLVRYQQELVVVLNALYGPLPMALPAPAPALTGDPALVPSSPALGAIIDEMRVMRDALLGLARAQQVTAQQAGALADRLGTVEDVVEELRQIIPVTPAQAEYLLRAIKHLGHRMEQGGRGQRNYYERLFAQFKLDMGIPRYDALPAHRYDDALAWLRQQAATLLPADPDALPPQQERLL